jgi:hypothetical protein
MKYIKSLFKKFYTLLVDLRFGGGVHGVVPTRYAHLGAETVANSDYAALKTIPWDIHGPDVLVDVGCGKGRVINWWLKCGFRNKYCRSGD